MLGISNVFNMFTEDVLNKMETFIDTNTSVSPSFATCLHGLNENKEL